MTADELLFAIAPDARAVAAAREVLRGDAFSGLTRSADGQWLTGRCRGSGREPYEVGVRRTVEEVRCECDCGSMKYPCKHALALLALHHDHPDRFTAREIDEGRKAGVNEQPAVALPQPAEAPKDTGEALLQAIYADPSDDAARLIYADWLSENGTEDEQGHAELIRVQTRILREGPSPELLKEEKRLLKAHRQQLLAEVPLELRNKVAFVGGFLRSVGFTGTQLRRHGEMMGQQFPIDQVRLTGKLTERMASDAAVYALWARVRALSLDGANVGSLAALHHLLGSALLRDLRALDLSGLHLGTRGMQILAGCGCLATVEVLRLDRARMNANALDTLAGSPHLKALRALHLRENQLEGDALRVITSAPRFANLTELHLPNNPIGPHGLRYLVAGQLPHLRVLDLSDNPITDAGARALAESPHLAGLAQLRLRGVALKDETKELLLQRFGERVIFEASTDPA